MNEVENLDSELSELHPDPDVDITLENSLIEELAPRLYRYFSAVFETNKASDLVQETLLRLWKKTNEKSIDGRKGNLTMFAYGIARNVKKEAFRHDKKISFSEKIIENTPYYEDSAETLDDASRIKQLRRAINQLKENEREVLCLVVDDELKLKEIAKLLNMPLGTVKSHIHRAKDNLKHQLLMNVGDYNE